MRLNYMRLKWKLTIYKNIVLDFIVDRLPNNKLGNRLLRLYADYYKIL